MIKYLNLKIVKMVNFMLFVSYVRAKSLQSCLTLRDPMSCGLPGSSVQGILQARILKWVAMWNGLPCLPPGALPDQGIKLASLLFPALAGGFFTTSATWEALFAFYHSLKKKRINFLKKESWLSCEEETLTRRS